MTSHAKGSALIILSALIYGLVPAFANTVYASGGTPMELSLLKGLLALPFLWPLARRQAPSFRMTPRLHRSILILSLSGTLTQMMLFSSYQYISSGLATTLHFTYPVFVVLACVLFCHEAPSRAKLLCTALCTAGIFLFYTPGNGFNLPGAMLAFASGITYAFYVVYLGRSEIGKMPPFAMAFWNSAYVSAETLLVLLASSCVTLSLTPAGWTAALVFSLLNAVVALAAFQAGVKIIGPQQAAILSTFEPITSIVVGVLAYHEPFGFSTAAGAGLILTAVILLAVFDRSPDPSSARGRTAEKGD